MKVQISKVIAFISEHLEPKSLGFWKYAEIFKCKKYRKVIKRKTKKG